MATKVTNGLDLSSQKIINVADPTADQDAATKKFVDDHNWASTDITDFAEAVDDQVNTLIVAGTGITKTYNDGAGTLTLAASGATSATVDVITASQTGGSGWLLPTGAKSVHVICIGGGGGGSGGGKGGGSAAEGPRGPGAAGGGRIEATFPASAIGTPGTTRVDVIVGAGGSSGNGATTTAAGTDGTDGGTSSFGTLLYAPGGKASVGGLVPYGGFQLDGTAAGRFAPFNGAQGGIQNTTATIYTGGAATGGGGGGGDSLGGSVYAGNTGSPIYLRSDLTIGADGAAGTSTTTANSTAGAGGAGTSRSGSGYCGGGGGGGGSQRATTGTTGIGGAGGAGGLPGGGGGGGGPSRSTSTRAGNGGAGGRGEVIITVYY